MTRNNASLAGQISAERPVFSYLRSYLFIKNAKLFLRGFALDTPPGGCYVWKYMFPLFSSLEFISLTFGYRLLDGYVDLTNTSKSKTLESTLLILDNNSDFVEDSLDGFLTFITDQRISSVARSEAVTLVEMARDMDPDHLKTVIAGNERKYGIAR